ncbi:MAG: GNAT family N-acetyltransferase [Lentisphaerae bacterium]|jgi:GNAT superfamily N-acetyltransferase|nr:GNAT family N-acetyltransferase [Lentisphaerota bacterium]
MSNHDITIHTVSTDNEITRTANLASAIWHECYASLISSLQIDYMLEQFQSTAAVAAQIKEGYSYFLVTVAETDAGYFATLPEPDKNRLFISKLYATAQFRGTGVGRAMLDHIETTARHARLNTLWLTVNKLNPTLSWYERRGFIRTAAVVSDIGNGFVMDDFHMEKHV